MSKPSPNKLSVAQGCTAGLSFESRNSLRYDIEHVFVLPPCTFFIVLAIYTQKIKKSCIDVGRGTKKQEGVELYIKKENANF
jgi:hypothetical protein